MPGITTAVKTANPEALYVPALPKGKHHAPRHITEGKIRSVDHRAVDGVDHRALDAHLECANVPARYILAIVLSSHPPFMHIILLPCLLLGPRLSSVMWPEAFLARAATSSITSLLCNILHTLSGKCGACSPVDWQRGQFGTLRMHRRAKLVCDDSCAGGYTHHSTSPPVGRVYGREADEHSLERSSWAPRQRCRSHAPASRATRPSVASRRTMISPSRRDRLSRTQTSRAGRQRHPLDASATAKLCWDCPRAPVGPHGRPARRRGLTGATLLNHHPGHGRSALPTRRRPVR